MSNLSNAKLPDWQADHLRRYLETDGADGHIYDASKIGGPKAVPALLLTTTGRRSGKALLLPLFYGETGDSYVIVASKGGAPEHPAWYLNLSANPEVHVQVRDKKFTARARTASGDERARLWEQMLKVWPPYADYAKKADREIPVVVLDPLG